MLMLPEARAVGGLSEPESAASPVPDPAVGRPTEHPSDIAALSRSIRPLSEIEREAIEHAVERCGGDVRKAAVLLGVAPATIYRRLRAWREDESGSGGGS